MFRQMIMSMFSFFMPYFLRSTAIIVVAFTASGDMKILLEELARKPFPPRQWIGSESWGTAPEFLKFGFCAGAIGFGIPQSVIPGFREYLLDLSPVKAAASQLLTELWEDAFNCQLEKSEILAICPITHFFDLADRDREFVSYQ